MRRLAIAAIAIAAAANAFSAVPLATAIITLRESRYFIGKEQQSGKDKYCVSELDHSFDYGSEVTLTAIPTNGLKIVRWRFAELDIGDLDGEGVQPLLDKGDSQVTFTLASPKFKNATMDYFIALDLEYAKYGLNFNDNGGDGGVPSISGLTITNSVTLPVPSERTGYSFDGVWTNASGVAFQAGKEIFPAEALGIRNADTNFTLYAKWSSNSFSIKYHLAGGVEGAEHPPSAAFGEAFKVSAPTRRGYVFKGWEFANINTETARYGTTSNPDTRMSTGSAYPSGGGDIWLKNLSTNSSPAVTMTATWEAKEYTANLSFTGASNSPTTSLTVTYDQPLPNVATVPVYASGADFLGYYTETGGRGLQFWDGEGHPNPAIKWTNDVDVTFYEFKGNARRQVVFNGNGGTPSQASKTVMVGAAYGDLPTASWVGDRYAFTGWFDDVSGGNEIVPAGIVADGFGNINLYAHWAVSNYCVRFDGNGATNETEMALQEIPFDAEMPLSANEYGKIGFSFAGWSADGSATVTYADCAVVSNLSSTAGETNVLTAVWTTNTYYVVFDANGGTGTMATLTNSYGKATVYPPNGFTRNEFWNFSCWSNTVSGATAASGDELLNLTDKDGDTVVIKAVWITTLTEFSQAMHCDNLQWNLNSGLGQSWVVETGADLGYNKSGSMVSQAGLSAKSLQAVVTTNGTFKFRCRIDSGEAGKLHIWAASAANTTYISAAPNTNEISIAASPDGRWQEISYVVATTGEPLYVNISNWTKDNESSNKICIDHMEWIPEGSDVPVEPGPGDEREFSSLACSGDSLFLSFPNADDRFSYVLRGTNDLVAPMPWPTLFSTNGTGSITIETKILPGVPCMFYYLETTTK